MPLFRLLPALLLLVASGCQPGFKNSPRAIARLMPHRIGPVSPRPAAALYLVVDEPTLAHLVIRRTASKRELHCLVRVFDPDEKIVFWRYLEEAGNSGKLKELQPDISLIPTSKRKTKAGDPVLHHRLLLESAGIYQVRLSCTHDEVSLELHASRDFPYGVCFQNGEGLPWAGQPERFYVYVPPHAETLTLHGGPAVLEKEDGTELARLDEKGAVDIPVKETRSVWRLNLPKPADWKLRGTGMPLILCSSAEAARQIRGSVEELPDGTVVCHKFQKRIAEVLPALLDPSRVGKTEELVIPLKTRKEAWLKNPLRNQILIGSFLPAIEKWLRSQNLDPESHWAGSLDGWQEKAKAKHPDNRWDRLRAVKGLYAGASSHYGAAAEHLALAALHDEPVNPYFGRKELLYRAAAAALRDLMVLQEDETFPGTADLNPYPGNMGFALGQKTFPVYGLAAPHLPAEIQKVWTEGLRHIIDRSFPDYLVSARNQSSHYLVAFQAFAEGSGNPLYSDMMRLYSRRWANGQHPAGYHMEALGPDASYIGMTHWHEAVYYRMSQDPLILDSLRKSYRLFNHTVGPEPDGKMLGGFNFNHRVGEGFYFEQWGGAKGILDDVLPEIGVWVKVMSAEEKAEAEEKAREQITNFLESPRHPRYPGITTWRYRHYSEPDRSGIFPCNERESFIRTFEDELVAIKRPGYYTYCYIGKPAGLWYIRLRENFRLPYPGDLENTGGPIPDMRKCTPFLGGGLSGFWTPAYGHFLLAANWSPTTHHGLIATQKDGKRYWEEYHAQTHTLDIKNGKLSFQGNVEGQPLKYQRTYTFNDHELAVTLTLEAEADVDLAGLVENIPIARGGWKARGATLDAGGKAKGTVSADRFKATDNKGAGVEVVLSTSHELRLVPDGLRTGNWRKLQVGRVEIVLPGNLRKGDRVELAYRMKPIQ